MGFKIDFFFYIRAHPNVDFSQGKFTKSKATLEQHQLQS